MDHAAENFQQRLDRRAAETVGVLERLVAPEPSTGETARPDRLVAAMRHGVLNGGKRLRPFLLIETAAMFGADGNSALRAAAALECVHCYSLIHDDLPAMDDDDLRRGQPTVHRAYDEATAILAGDALLTLAFDILADPATHPDPQMRSDLVVSLARSAGVGGMAGGQMLDLAAEGRTLGEDDILLMQSMKTGALLRHACEAGAVLGGATSAERAALLDYGRKVGMAFQLADDILDVTASAAEMGKQTAKDGDRGKATLVSLYGLEESRSRALELLEDAVNAIRPFGGRARWLEEAARFVVNRDR